MTTKWNEKAIADLDTESADDPLDVGVAELVYAMNRAGLRTISSCEGHGLTEDGEPAYREMMIALENVTLDVHNSCDCCGTGRQVLVLRWGLMGPESTYQYRRMNKQAPAEMPR